MESPDINELLRDLVIEVNQAYRWLAEQAGINHTDLMCLYLVRAASGQATPTAIAQQLGMSTGATAIMLNRLEAAGFVVRKPHPTDRRGVLIALGSATEQTGVLGLRDYVANLNRRVVDRYSPEEMAIVRRFFADVVQNTRDALVAARSGAPTPEALGTKASQPAP